MVFQNALKTPGKSPQSAPAMSDASTITMMSRNVGIPVKCFMQNAVAIPPTSI